MKAGRIPMEEPLAYFLTRTAYGAWLTPDLFPSHFLAPAGSSTFAGVSPTYVRGLRHQLTRRQA
jgi:hypothetical protein